MKPTEQLTKIRSLRLFLSAHPENEPDSEMADRLSDVEELEEAISQMQPEWVAIEQYPKKKVLNVMRWHKIYHCVVTVQRRGASYEEKGKEWLSATFENKYSEADFEPFFQYLPQPPTK